MSETLFDIVFHGIVQPGKDRELAMQNMAKLFKTDPGRIRPYFSGERKVIKSKVDQQVAEKYRAALENIGLVIKLEPLAAAPETPDNSSPQAVADDKTDSVAADSGNLSVAEPGADVLPNPPPVTPQPIGDISALSMAEVGADVLENPQPVTPQPIGDISALSMAEVGADVLAQPPASPAPPAVDTSSLSLAEPGADVFEHPPEKPEAPSLDTHDLTLDDRDS